MPLLDHFHPPLSERRPWEGFHGFWCPAMVEAINRHLPRRFYGDVNIHLGASVAADVAEFERPRDDEEEDGSSRNGPGGVAVADYAPPAVSCTLAGTFPDDIEVRIIDTHGDARLVAVIELVSLSNKDRPDARRDFAAKCLAYLQRGVGLAVIDVVTCRAFNLHDQLAGMMGQPGAAFPEPSPAYAASYRPRAAGEAAVIDVWRWPLVAGEALPIIPLHLRGWGAVPLDLEWSYMRAREIARI